MKHLILPITGCQETKRTMFTLLELLIVIAIIAVLAGMLLPALSQVRGKAQGITCVSNLKQIGLGLAEYVHDSDNTLPPYAYNTSSISPTWVDFLMGPSRKTGTYTSYYTETNWGTSPQGTYISLALLECPTAMAIYNKTKTAIRDKGGMNPFIGANSHIFNRFNPSSTAPGPGVKLDRLRAPTKKILLSDVSCTALSNRGFIRWTPRTDWCGAYGSDHGWGYVDARHLNAANLLHAAGNVSTLKIANRYEPYLTDPLRYVEKNYPYLEKDY